MPRTVFNDSDEEDKKEQKYANVKNGQIASTKKRNRKSIEEDVGASNGLNNSDWKKHKRRRPSDPDLEEGEFEDLKNGPTNKQREHKMIIREESFHTEFSFSTFHSEICADGKIACDTWKALLALLRENQKNSQFRTEVAPLCDLKFLSGLLWRYNCTLMNETDSFIYDILEHLERRIGIDFRIVSPMVFGEKSKNYYSELIKYGRTLHKSLTPDQVLEYFDQKRMWNTLVRMNGIINAANNEQRAKRHQDCYDPRFVLRTLVQLVRPGTKLNCKKMVTSNSLSFCFASTSIQDTNLRAVAYAFLERFRRRLFELTDERFPQRIVYYHLLLLFKNSITYANQRTNNLIGQFLARVSKVALLPEDPLYAPLMSFLTQKPWIELDTVPEFLKLFFSTSTEFCLKERQWMLRLFSDSIVDSQDYGVICKVFVLESCMALFCTPLADYWSKLLLLKIFGVCIQLKSVARDMFLRLDFTSWLANTISHPRTTVMEQFELTALLRRLVQQCRGFLSTEEGEDTDNNNKLANLELRRPLLRAKFHINAQKVMEHLNRDGRIVSDEDTQKRDQLLEWLRSTHF